MKELQIKQKVGIEQSVKKKKQIEHKFIGDLVQHKNHTMFQINDETLEISLAEYSTKNYVVGGDNKREIIIKKGYSYVSALNKENALKKYNKEKNGRKEIIDEPLTFF